MICKIALLGSLYRIRAEPFSVIFFQGLIIFLVKGMNCEGTGNELGTNLWKLMGMKWEGELGRNLGRAVKERT